MVIERVGPMDLTVLAADRASGPAAHGEGEGPRP